MTELDEEIKKYLPRYLSDAELGRLKDELAKFPTDGTKGTIYTHALANADYLLQGDCIGGMDYVAFPNLKGQRDRFLDPLNVKSEKKFGGFKKIE